MSIATRHGAKRDAPSDDGVAAQPRGALFGRRKGHKLRAHQADLIEQLLPRLSLDIAGPSPPDLADLFDPRVDEVRLEIGFGGGEHLIAEARAFANVGFIGCEPYVNGMAKILTQIEAHNIGNVRLFAGAAATFADPDRPDPSRSLAEAAALEAALRAGRNRRRHGAGSKTGR